MLIQRKLALISMLIELTGILLLVFVVSASSLERAAAAQPVIPTREVVKAHYEDQTIHGTPSNLSIASLGINTSINNGYYDETSGRWSISEDAAYYATMSDEANTTAGSTFIYGHNSDKIFGKLHQITAGTVAQVQTSNGYEFTYKLTSVENVLPTDTEKLVYDGKPRLVLQTCSGIWNNTRQLSYFSLVSYKKL